MKKFFLVSIFAIATTTAGMNTIANAAAAIPCEDILVTLNDALAKAKLNDADAKAVADLKAKGEERCTAEDDRRADGFFNDALAIINKK
jgi:prolyl-tRNA synthetase